MEERKHTDLPWTTTSMTKLGDLSGKVYEITVMPKSRYHSQHVAKCWDEKEIGRNGGLTLEHALANAELIVTAVNSYYTLTEQNAKLKSQLGDLEGERNMQNERELKLMENIGVANGAIDELHQENAKLREALRKLILSSSTVLDPLDDEELSQPVYSDIKKSIQSAQSLLSSPLNS